MSRVRRRGRELAARGVFGLMLASLAGAEPARASWWDPFGWFSEKPPAVSATTLPYKMDVKGIDGDDQARTAVNDASILYRLRAEPPADGDELVRRAEADLPRIIDALWGSGYYAANVSIVIAGDTVALQRPSTTRTRQLSERYKGTGLVPVEVVVDPGPQYTFNHVAILDARNRPFAPNVLPPDTVTLKANDPARTTSLIAAAAQISDHFRDEGHPFVKVVRRQPTIDHRTRSVDLVLSVEPGPVAGLGDVTIKGAEGVDPAVIRSFIYAERGDKYSPKALAAIRKSVARIEALGAVRIREGEALDADGNLPLTVEVTERPLRVIGGAVRYSTVDGPALKTYWAHRNLFGGAERLRFDLDLFYMKTHQDWLPPDQISTKKFDPKDIGGRVAASFMKPALWGTRNDLLADIYLLRERNDFYTANLVNATVAIRHRFTDAFSMQVGLEGEIGDSRDPLNAVTPLHYGLVGLPVSLTYDSTDRPLDPTMGWRVTGSIAPYMGLRDAPNFFGIAKIQASTYYALDEKAKYILAARVAFGSILGGDLADIPASRRFYVGGGGSVRGFKFKSLGPTDPFGFVVGGKSMFEASLEARIKITDTIGIVPFIDMGQAYESSFPDGSAKMRFAAGLGLRYYTALGPIRLDVATPLQKMPGERPFAVYVSLGQAF